MVAQSVSGIIRRVFIEFWSRSRKQKEPVVAETVKEVKKELIPVCPPLQSQTYTPPEGLQSRLESYIPLEDGCSQFNLLAHLADDLGHVVPNSRIHQLCRIRDVLGFYNVPIQDRSKFYELNASNLPPNLKITWSY
uniref:Large ribosomal subunit protein mL50 n=1 Tax=Cercocebus atys TaxID=9531 RepID=A0A2K5MBZ5_CERAT